MALSLRMSSAPSWPTCCCCLEGGGAAAAAVLGVGKGGLGRVPDPSLPGTWLRAPYTTFNEDYNISIIVWESPLSVCITFLRAPIITYILLWTARGNEGGTRYSTHRQITRHDHEIFTSSLRLCNRQHQYKLEVVDKRRFLVKHRPFPIIKDYMRCSLGHSHNYCAEIVLLQIFF